MIRHFQPDLLNSLLTWTFHDLRTRPHRPSAHIYPSSPPPHPTPTSSPSPFNPEASSTCYPEYGPQTHSTPWEFWGHQRLVRAHLQLGCCWLTTGPFSREKALLPITPHPLHHTLPQPPGVQGGSSTHLSFPLHDAGDSNWYPQGMAAGNVLGCRERWNLET